VKNFIISIIFFSLGFSLHAQIRAGAYQTKEYLPLLDGKKVGIIANQSSLIASTHLVDSLISLHIDVVKVFAPEHGFRGKAEAGAHIKDGKDSKTGLTIVSLYGKNKKPKAEQLQNIDVMLFDLQGVGVRFYTYISTLTYIMEACAENNIPLIVLDRPNPHAHYIDGPLLKEEYKSFVGMLPIPVVYGMTDGELAQMINGEKWLKNGIHCDLSVIKINNYNHQMAYELNVSPSPNLPNFQSIYLYPSLCFFEGTPISIGRGTDTPFQVIGYPEYPKQGFSFTPKSKPGYSMHPKFENQECYGINLQNLYTDINEKPQRLEIKWLLDFYQSYPDQEHFFTSFFDKLAGNHTLKQQIIDGWTEEMIRESWKSDLSNFRELRRKYLLYDE